MGNNANLEADAYQVPNSSAILQSTCLVDVGEQLELVFLLEILTDVLDQNLGRRHIKVVRCMGKARVCETSASSFRSDTADVDSLKEQVTTLKGQLEVQGEQMREHIMAQDEQLQAYAGHMSDLVRAIQMNGLQISLPVPDLDTPSTSEPLHPIGTSSHFT